ncbi:hypothetical protein F511_03588 [Dorcoceras hygrometricum]|uniref:Uncharacterized protein n=1 Tax=Dorcoceras hygrometricum TaxID=472368 RepID=A0A2Z7D482_9LAMI|nr:hypothetical protein F511_03588 [Dorcoceras hygrometricum]
MILTIYLSARDKLNQLREAVQIQLKAEQNRIGTGGAMPIELQSSFSKGKCSNICSDELTDCTRSVDAKISRAGEAIS